MSDDASCRAFTRWLVKALPGAVEPARFDAFDQIVLAFTALAIPLVLAPVGSASASEIVAGLSLVARLARWRSERTGREPLVVALQLGYGCLALGLLLGSNAFVRTRTRHWTRDGRGLRADDARGAVAAGAGRRRMVGRVRPFVLPYAPVLARPRL